MAEKMTLLQYLDRRGLGFPVGGYMIDKLKIPHGQTRRQRDKMMKEALEFETDYQAKRSAAISEYKEKVKNGEIIKPTEIEKSIMVANGHPDNASTQAARRMLAKRGINWEDYKMEE